MTTPKDPKDDETEAITVRIPSALKAAVDACAATRGTTLTGMVRDALQDAVAPQGRKFELPGFSEPFNEFLEKLRREKILLLVVNDRTGERYFFEGAVNKTLSNASIVTLAAQSETWVIPRRDIVGWFGADESELASLNKLAIALRKLGWPPRSAYY